MKTRVRELVEQGDRLFNGRTSLMQTWQEMALNFCPWLADFTGERKPGEEFASHLMTGRPVLAHRDLTNALSAMLRPRGKEWFHARTDDEATNNDVTARAWLDRMSDQMRRAMYSPGAQLAKATKETDAFFTLIGWGVIEPAVNRDASGLLHRSWHPRDVAFCENVEGRLDVLHRTWKIEARGYVRHFRGKAHADVVRLAEKEPGKPVKCRHIVIPADDYDLCYGKDGEGRKARVNRARFPFVSLYIDCEHDHILEEVPRKRFGYVVPRWVTMSGTPYPISLATMTALPDARLLQRITLSLLEAGEMAVNPPLKATRGAVGAVNWFPGGTTWVDELYDEKTGPAVEALLDVHPNFGFGDNREQKIEQMIAEAFYLNKIALPPAEVDGDMTKWEAQQRVEEYIRNALPLFEPMEVEYNAALCEEDWHLIADMNGFGPLDDIPDALKGREIRWQFETPLREANERQKAQAFVQAGNILAIAAGMAKSGDRELDRAKATRDALIGAGAPADWLVPPEVANAAKDADAKAALAQELAATVGTGADVAGKVGAGVQQLQQAGM